MKELSLELLLTWFSEALRKHGHWDRFYCMAAQTNEKPCAEDEMAPWYQLRSVVEKWLYSKGRGYLDDFCKKENAPVESGAAELADELLKRLHWHYKKFPGAADPSEDTAPNSTEAASTARTNFYNRLGSKARERNRSVCEIPRLGTGAALCLLKEDCLEISNPRFHRRPERDVSLADGEEKQPALDAWADYLQVQDCEYHKMLERPVDMFGRVPNPERRKGVINEAVRHKFRSYVYRVVSYSTPRYWWPTGLVLDVWKNAIYKQAPKAQRVDNSADELALETNTATEPEVQCDEDALQNLLRAVGLLFQSAEGGTLKRLRRNMAGFLRSSLRKPLNIAAHDDFLGYSYRTLAKTTADDPEPANQFIMSLRLRVNRERFGGDEGEMRFKEEYGGCLSTLATELWDRRFEFFPNSVNSSTPIK